MKRWEIYLDIIMELLVILAGALLLILYYQKQSYFMAICSRMDYFNDGPPSDRISGEEGKITEEVRFCDLDRGSYHRNHSGSLFCSQRYRTAGHRIYTGCTRYPS